MPRITHPTNIKYANPNQRRLSLPDYNGLVQAARTSTDIHRGVSNDAGLSANKDRTSIRHWVRLKAHANIPDYSIFTVEPGGFGYSLEEPAPLSAQFNIGNENTCVFLTNDQDTLYTNADYRLPICDFARPFLYRYESSDGTPQIGNRIGPKFNSYNMSLAGNNLSFAVVSEADTTNFLVWCVKACVSSTGFAIPMFEFTEILYPGYVATARRLKFNGTIYEIDSSDVKQYKLYDPEEQNMFLPFERVHAVIAPNLGVFADYEILGEHGLHRKVLVNGAVDCGQTGDTFVYTNATKIHPPPKHPTDPDCDLAGSAAQLKVCNKYGYRRKIEDQEIATVDWDVGRQAWVFEQEDRGNVIEVTITDKMCGQNTTVAVTGARYYDWQGDTCSLTPDPDVTSVTNSMSLACGPNTKALCHRKEDTIGADEWHIFEVKHRDFFLLRPDGAGQGVCPEWVIKQREFAVMTCEEIDDDYIKITSTAIPAITNLIINENCGIQVYWNELCVLGVGDGGNYSYPMERVNFFEGVSSSPGDCEITFTGKSGCVFFPGDGPSGTIATRTEKVAYGISEDSVGTDPRCTNLLTKDIYTLDCDPINESSEVIFCVIDCEDEPTTVLAEANTAGTVSVANRQTQPYNTETNNLNNDDIVIQLPASPEEGEIVAIANNTMEETTVKVDAGTNLVQALSAPYTAAFVSIGGPMLNVSYMARLIGGGIQWRIV